MLPAEHLSDHDDPSLAGFDEPQPPRRVLPGPLYRLARRRWARWAAAALACLVAGGFMLVAVTSERSAVRQTPPAARPVAPPAIGPVVPQQPWPRGPGSCGAQRFLPIVDAAPLRTDTGVRVQVGGQTVHTADLDARSLAPAPGLRLSDNQFVSQLAPGKDASYALVRQCDSTGTSSVLRISRDSNSVVQASNRHIESLLPDGRGGLWVAQVEDIATNGPVTLVQLPGPGVVRLPAGLRPVAVWGTKLIGLTTAAGERQSPFSGTLVSYDLASRKLGPRIGHASSLTVSAGVLLWLDEPCTLTAECALHRYDLATGARSVRDYTLPVETSIVGGVISPDGGKLAFPLAQIYEGQRADFDGFGPPYNVAVLHLDSGKLERIGGLKLPATEMPGLAFSAGGEWLVIGLNERRGGALLVWRPGLAQPLRFGVRIRDVMLQAPPLLVVNP